MREAKSLGIPLRQPGTGRAPARRCSVSHVTDNDGPPATDSCNVWSCSHCHRTVVDKPKTVKSAADTAPVLQKTASPFKDMFRLFGRKDSRSKLPPKQTLTLPRGYVARCEGCDQPEVTSSSPCSRRRAEMTQSMCDQGHAKVKYRRSASTPRPGHGGDAKLQVHSGSELTASRSTGRRAHGQLRYCLCVCVCVHQLCNSPVCSRANIMHMRRDLYINIQQHLCRFDTKQ